MRRGALLQITLGVFLLAAVGCSDDTKPPQADLSKPDVGKAEMGVVDKGMPKEGGAKEGGAKEGGAKEAGKVDAAPVPIDFASIVEAFGSNPPTNVPGVTVELYDNDTGKGTGTTKTTDSTGKAVFPGLLKGKLYGFKMSLANYKDTFIWNMKAEAPKGTCTKDADCGSGKKCDVPGNACVERLTATPNTVYQASLALAGLTAVAGKSVVAGAIYWVDAAGKDEPIGCAKVTSTPATPDVRYMSATTGLPTTLANQACTADKNGKGLGRFVAANLDAGSVTISAGDSKGGAIGSTKIWAIADAIVIGNIYAAASVTANPTPTTCACP